MRIVSSTSIPITAEPLGNVGNSALSADVGSVPLAMISVEPVAGVLLDACKSSIACPAAEDIVIWPVGVVSSLILSSNLSKLAVKVELIKLKSELNLTDVKCGASRSLKLDSLLETLALVMFAFSVAILFTRLSGLPVLLMREAIAWK